MRGPSTHRITMPPNQQVEARPAIGQSALLRDAATPEVAAGELMVIVNRLQVFCRFLERPVFMAQLCAAVERGMERHFSDHLRPSSAAVYADCSESFIYQMIEAGVIRAFGGPGMVVVSKAEIDAAIREGRWHSAKTSKRQASKSQNGLTTNER